MTSRGPGSFMVQDTLTPTSDVTDDASSGDDVSSYYTATSGDPPMEQRLYVINRAGSGEASYLPVSPDRQHITSYSLRTEKWRPIVDLTNFGVAVLDNSLFIIGGFDRRHARHLSRVVRFDPSEGTWTPCAPMHLARAKFGVCTSGNKIFVCGGERSDGRVTGSCEIYDAESDTWSKAAMLPQPRANAVCAAHRKELYCAGGYNGNTSHQNLWMYEEYRWGEVDQDYPHVLPNCLDRCAIAVHDNTFYFLGGVSAKRREKEERPKFSTERRAFSYSTHISALPREVHSSRGSDLISPWNLKLPSLNHARHSAGAVALGHKIYVVGGTILETGQQVRIAEYMDTRTGMWEDDFNFRKGDVSNVACTLLAVPKIPVSQRKMAYRLRWVMW
ncbi:kelch-like protein 26 [Babylonia areolata]|uniref:kelch-like protein 26 n=1 Tax=Babylonia areolata TaxID=304850 RepID=UPI003FD47ED9